MLKWQFEPYELEGDNVPNIVANEPLLAWWYVQRCPLGFYWVQNVKLTLRKEWGKPALMSSAGIPEDKAHTVGALFMILSVPGWGQGSSMTPSLWERLEYLSWSLSDKLSSLNNECSQPNTLLDPLTTSFMGKNCDTGNSCEICVTDTSCGLHHKVNSFMKKKCYIPHNIYRHTNVNSNTHVYYLCIHSHACSLSLFHRHTNTQ